MLEVKLNNLESKISETFEVKMLKWKSEIVDAVEVFTKEIRDEREFREINSYQTTNNTQRIEKLEKKVFGSVSQA